MNGRRPRVLLGSTGSVASIKVAALCQLLLEFADVKLIVTNSARNFINEADLPDAVKPVLGDESEWRQWQAVGDPVLHIELRRWADVLVVAPLSANSLAKMANGLADNLLTCVVRAWDFAKPMLIAPAMNTAMWNSPFTSRHLDTLLDLGRTTAAATAAAAAVGSSTAASTTPNLGFDIGSGSRRGSSGSPSGSRSRVVVVPPVSKRLACGDEGTGAMAAPRDIAASCREALVAVHLPPPPPEPLPPMGANTATATGPAVPAGPLERLSDISPATTAREAAGPATKAALGDGAVPVAAVSLTLGMGGGLGDAGVEASEGSLAEATSRCGIPEEAVMGGEGGQEGVR